MANVGFGGVDQGAVQTSYFDQPTFGQVGQLHSNVYRRLIDGFPAEDTVFVGRGVVRGTDITVPTNAFEYPSAPFTVRAPEVGDAASTFVGIVVRDDKAQNNSDGVPIVSDGRETPVLRSGRIYVNSPLATTHGQPVHMLLADVNNVGLAGEFVNAAQGSNSILVADAIWYGNAAAGDTGVIEFNLP